MTQVTAVIVCGGRGSRLGPLGDVVNKNVLPVDGVPAVVHVAMTAIQSFHARRCVLLTGHLGHQVEHVDRAYLPDFDVEFVSDRRPGGTAAAVRRVVTTRDLGPIIYAHANVVLGAAAVEKLAHVAETGSSAWAVSNALLAPTHPRLRILDGHVHEAGNHFSAYSVGFGTLDQNAARDAGRRPPSDGQTTEEWLFTHDAQGHTTKAVDIGHDWFHIEDLASYHSRAGSTAFSRPRRVA